MSKTVGDGGSTGSGRLRSYHGITILADKRGGGGAVPGIGISTSLARCGGSVPE